MGIGSQDSADFSGVRSAGYPPLPARGEVDHADVLLNAKDITEGINRSRIFRPGGMNDAAVPSSPVRAIADSGLASIAVTTPDLVPTTFRMMGNVLYLHTPTGKVLLEVGNLSPSELGTKLDLRTKRQSEMKLVSLQVAKSIWSTGAKTNSLTRSRRHPSFGHLSPTCAMIKTPPKC